MLTKYKNEYSLGGIEQIWYFFESMFSLLRKWFNKKLKFRLVRIPDFYHIKSDDKENVGNIISLFIRVISFSGCEHFIVLLIKASFTFSGCVFNSVALGLAGVLMFFSKCLSLYYCFFSASLHTLQWFKTKATHFLLRRTSFTWTD